MGRPSRLGSILIPLLGGGRLDQRPSFSLFIISIYHLIPCLMLTLGIITSFIRTSFLLLLANRLCSMVVPQLFTTILLLLSNNLLTAWMRLFFLITVLLEVFDLCQECIHGITVFHLCCFKMPLEHNHSCFFPLSI